MTTSTKSVVARCSRCKGWTMFHADVDSDTGREWSAQCRKAGDIIVVGVLETMPPPCSCDSATRTTETTP